jgi:hypothetical protein
MKKEFFLIVLLVVLSLFFCFPLIFPLNKIVFEESYLQFCSYLDLNIIHFFRDYHLPLWSFHFGGGYPFIKHPDNISLSPLFYLLILPFGSANGLKLLLLFSYATGAIGFFLFARRIMRFNLLTSVITSMLFLFNSFIPFQINTGNIRDPGWLFLPLLLYLAIKSKEDHKYLIFSAFLMTVMAFNGFSLYFVPLFLFLFLFALLDDMGPKSQRINNDRSLLLCLLIISVIAFFLSAAKLVPVFDLLKTNMREIAQYSKASEGSMTLKTMFMAFFSRGPYAVGNEATAGPEGLGMSSVMFIGIIPGILFVFSSIFCIRRVWKFLVIILLFLLLSMANNSPVDLFYVLWHLPLFNSIHECARYFSFPVVFLIPVVIGAFLSSAGFAGLDKKMKFLIYCMTLIGVLNMFVANTKYYEFSGKYQVSIPGLQTGKEFFQIKAGYPDLIENIPFYDANKKWTGKYEKELPCGLQYYLLRQNIGLINWYGNLNLTQKAIPRYIVTMGYGDYWNNFREKISVRNGVFRNDNYRGEAFFLRHKENKITSISFNTNKIAVDFTQNQSDDLIINQNYDKDWKSNIGNVYNANGLTGVSFDKPAKGSLLLRYVPFLFYLGLTISLISLLCCLLFILRPFKTKTSQNI